jgi:hypothetical protein
LVDNYPAIDASLPVARFGALLKCRFVLGLT